MITLSALPSQEEFQMVSFLIITLGENLLFNKLFPILFKLFLYISKKRIMVLFLRITKKTRASFLETATAIVRHHDIVSTADALKASRASKWRFRNDSGTPSNRSSSGSSAGGSSSRSTCPSSARESTKFRESFFRSCF